MSAARTALRINWPTSLSTRSLPALVQPPARPLRLGAHRCRLALAAARELAALAQRAALMPGRLDQQPPCVRVGGLGDGALVAPLTTR
jgi:hypothetical protein